MKKLSLSAALVLAVAGSWAFYPKASPKALGGIMMLVGHLSGRVNELQIIAPDGQTTSQPLTEKHITDASILALHKAELVELNRLKAEGWEVIETNNAHAAAGIIMYEDTYLLRRQ